MVVFPVYKAKSQLSKLIRLALQGEKVFISRGGGDPDIELVPAQKHASRRFGGLSHHKFKIARDFNAPVADFADYEK